MKTLKRLLAISWLSIFWTASLFAATYGQRISTAELDSNGIKKTLPGALITVCSAWGGNGCTALAHIYSDCNGAQEIQQPLQADQQGNYSYCAVSPGAYLEAVSAPGRGQVFSAVVYMPSTGYGTIEVAGVALPSRSTINFVSGATCVDNSALNRTDCTISGGGGSGTIGGSGTTGFLPEFSDSTTLENSPMSDNGTTLTTSENLAVGTAASTASLGLNTTAGSNNITTPSGATGYTWTLPAATGTLPATSSASLTDGATVTWAMAGVQIAQASLLFTTHGGSRTLNITSPAAPGIYTLIVQQDATGGENLTLGTGCTWKVSGGGAGAITLSSGANAIDVLTFSYNGTNCYATLTKNFT